MMRSEVKAALLLVITVPLVLLACSKYKDPPPAGQDDRLTNPYCNDSRAINYNWGFPGKPDNSVCIYPVDPFVGSWSFTDTAFLPNGDMSGTPQVRNLVFTGTEDTALTHMSVTGWCGGNTPFYITANKYYKAEGDTLLGTGLGQYLCNNTDTMTGTFTWSINDTTKVKTIRLELTVTNASGIIYHKGTAQKL